MQEVIDNLVPGMILEEDIMYLGAILINKGTELTPELIDKIKRFNINNVSIVSKKVKKVEDTENTVSDDLCDELKESISNCNVSQIKETTKNMIENVLSSINSDGEFTNLKYDLKMFKNINSLDHSVRTAIFSIVLARLYNDSIKNYTRYHNPTTDLVNIYDVALAALLQDKSSNMKNTNILNHVKKFVNDPKIKQMFPGIENTNTETFDEIYIPVYSFCMIYNHPEISENVKSMVLYSAETDNNDVLLQNVKLENVLANNIAMGSRIIHFCNLYDSFLAHIYNTDESFENIISILGQFASTGVVNEELTKLFFMKVPIYPIGAKLILSTGEKAEVLKTFVGYTYTTRPFVKVLSSGKKIDLRSETNITVNCISKDDVLLDDVVNDQVNEASMKK